MNEKLSTYQLIRIAACILVLILSITVITPIASKPDSYKGTIAELNEKERTVMKVTAATTVASIGIGAIPGDATTPVANEIMDLAGYLVVVLCAIVMEKYLLTMAGYLVFHWLIPIVCILLALNTFLKSQLFTRIVTRILVFCLVCVLVVPLSVRISNLIEKTNKVSVEMTRIENIVYEPSEEAEHYSDEDDLYSDENEGITEEGNQNDSESSEGFLSKLFTAFSTAKQIASSAVDSAVDTARSISTAAATLSDEAISKAKDTFWDLVETVVSLIVINFIIPILVLVVLLWAVNKIFGLQIRIPDPKKFTKRMHRNNNSDL